jgi:hypothetical protein
MPLYILARLLVRFCYSTRKWKEKRVMKDKSAAVQNILYIRTMHYIHQSLKSVGSVLIDLFLSLLYRDRFLYRPTKSNDVSDKISCCCCFFHSIDETCWRMKMRTPSDCISSPFYMEDKRFGTIYAPLNGQIALSWFRNRPRLFYVYDLSYFLKKEKVIRQRYSSIIATEITSTAVFL